MLKLILWFSTYQVKLITIRFTLGFLELHETDTGLHG
ncbi:hypothetical protein CFT9_26936 [Pseudomonas sp. CFT9]|nr:hypothetical protein CFT9_26936 [Pseudomonas sp. CFT9]